jgi:hypothetical protein
LQPVNFSFLFFFTGMCWPGVVHHWCFRRYIWLDYLWWWYYQDPFCGGYLLGFFFFFLLLVLSIRPIFFRF